MADDPYIAQPLLPDALEIGAHAWLMHFAADEVGVLQGCCDLCRGFPHAEPDFQHDGRGASERGGKIQGGLPIGQ